tara:strand:+ start:1071 stop:1646 length:576 start_codon:yes stop_codon:yes gene_type:complete
MTTIFRKRGLDNSNFKGRTAAVNRVKEVMQLARDSFPRFTLANSDLPIVFFKTGSSAGHVKYTSLGWGKQVFNLELNTVGFESDFDQMMDDTIPHEIAHVVEAFIHGESSHGPRWNRIAKQLGCSGERCHEMDMSKATRKRNRAIYIATCGTTVKVTMNRHNKIQKGDTSIVKATRGRLTANEFTGKMVSI